MTYKLIAMDMDGTLTNSEKKISPLTKAALLQVQKLGVKLVLASGRPTAGLYREAKELQMEKYGGYLLSFNGACVCEYPSKKVLHEQTISSDYVLPIINNAKALNLGIMVHHGSQVVSDDKATYKLDYEAATCNMEIKLVKDLRSDIDFGLHKVLISAPQEYLKTQYDDFRLPFGDLLSISTSAPFYIEVVPNGIDKGASLAKLAQAAGISPKEIIAFGDEMNDLTMLQFAGCGVAMGNAVKPIKLIADEVTAGNDEDGIAWSLKKHFPAIEL